MERILHPRKKKKSLLDEDIEESYDYDENSDIPVTEKKVKEGHIKRVK